MTTPTGTTASVARTLTLIDKDAARAPRAPRPDPRPLGVRRRPARLRPRRIAGRRRPGRRPVQGRIPEEYQRASDEELHARISAARQTLGERVVVLGHFYQRDEVVQHGDFVGDSFQLARASQGRPEAEAIVFCGVHFMAETADLLSTPDQAVILPNLAAGCSMADMADLDSVEDAWEQLEAVYGTEPDDDGRVPLLPVTYMNSSAALKGFVGERGGIVCTSSNASAVLDWAFERAQRVLFFPDQHLGRNTGRARGSHSSRCRRGTPPAAGRELRGRPAGREGPAVARLLLGAPPLHRGADRAGPRRAPGRPGDRAPRVPLPVVEAADSSGSTDFIVKAIQAAPAGSTFAIGTEINLVQRLAAQHPEHTIFCLDPVICPCSTMYRIHPGYLAWVLEELVAGRVVNRITVPASVADPARTALERMLAVAPKQSAAQSAGAGT